MPDITTVWTSDLSRGDWRIVGPTLQTGDDLSTALLISIFTDRQALPDDVIPDGTTNRRGWWADDSTRPIGSRLWLLDRAKQTTETLNRARDYIEEAIQWLIDDGVVAKFDLTLEWVRRGMLGAQITAYRRDGSLSAMKFSWAWESQPAAMPVPAPLPPPELMLEDGGSALLQEAGDLILL